MREKAEFVRERLESVRITQADYNTVLEGLSHVHTESWLDGILLWLEAVNEWGDADFDLPDFARGLLREQAELDWDDDPAPIELFRGNMNTEKLKAMWDALRTARQLEQRYMGEYDGETPSEFVYKIALSIFIEDNRGAGKPAGAANRAPAPACPQCGGAMYDNRDNKKNPKAPDFRCKDKNCTDDSGYQTSVWEHRANGGGRPKPKPAAPPPAEPAPVAAGYDPDSELPF